MTRPCESAECAALLDAYRRRAETAELALARLRLLGERPAHRSEQPRSIEEVRRHYPDAVWIPGDAPPTGRVVHVDERRARHQGTGRVVRLYVSPIEGLDGWWEVEWDLRVAGAGGALRDAKPGDVEAYPMMTLEYPPALLPAPEG